MSNKLKLPALNPVDVAALFETDYPSPFDKAVQGRLNCPIGRALSLTSFGVHIVELPPGCWSSQRHWHSHEDEFAYVLEGEATLVTDAGEQTLLPGHATGFPKGQADGHHFINRTDKSVLLLVVGDDSDEDVCSYSDADIHLPSKAEGYTDKAGNPLLGTDDAE